MGVSYGQTKGQQQNHTHCRSFRQSALHLCSALPSGCCILFARRSLQTHSVARVASKTVMLLMDQDRCWGIIVLNGK